MLSRWTSQNFTHYVPIARDESYRPGVATRSSSWKSLLKALVLIITAGTTGITLGYFGRSPYYSGLLGTHHNLIHVL